MSSDSAVGPPIADHVAQRNLELLDEGVRLVALAGEAGVPLRLLGGAGVLMHCPGVRARGGSRPIADVDVIVGSGEGRALSHLLLTEGYKAEERFNALHGHHRMIFHGSCGRLDVVVGAFQMCHRIPMTERLHLDRPTISVSDLLLTKLQIVELNEKDARDAMDLLDEHVVTRDEGDAVNLEYLDSLVRADWGLWRTAMGTLERLRELAGPDTAAKVEEIKQSFLEVPKSARWRFRARLGERLPWYVLPEESG